MPAVCSPEHLEKVRRLRKLLAAYTASEDLIRVGAYQKGLDPVLDQAIEVIPALTKFLQQREGEKVPLSDTLVALQALPG
jgi:flagellum-specific ATP synthase